MSILNENQVVIYTTKHGVPFQSQKLLVGDKFIQHSSIHSAIKYADKHLCTIVCTEDNEVIWTGGPVTASQLFSAIK